MAEDSSVALTLGLCLGIAAAVAILFVIVLDLFLEKTNAFRVGKSIATPGLRSFYGSRPFYEPPFPSPFRSLTGSPRRSRAACSCPQLTCSLRSSSRRLAASRPGR